MNTTDTNRAQRKSGMGVAVIAGAVLGAAAAIALSDKKTREKMQKGVSDVSQQVGKWMQQSDDVLEAGGQKLDETKELIADKAEDISKSAKQSSSQHAQ